MDENPYAPPSDEDGPEPELTRRRLNTLEVMSFSWVTTGVFAAVLMGIATRSLLPMMGGFVLAIVLNTAAFTAIATVVWLTGRLSKTVLPIDVVSAACGAASAWVVSSCLFEWFDSWLIASADEPVAVPVVSLLGMGWNIVLRRLLDSYWYIEN